MSHSVGSIFIPRDRVLGGHRSFAFVEFQFEEDADYAIKVMSMVKLYNRTLNIKKVGCASPCASASTLCVCTYVYVCACFDLYFVCMCACVRVRVCMCVCVNVCVRISFH